jgi:hypothetical protein
VLGLSEDERRYLYTLAYGSVATPRPLVGEGSTQHDPLVGEGA